ncbi:MAG: BLUF domain-containing protein [Brevundimonas sp.]|uniref:BLUF domain-containing protein n=1 Tax=Brevundimonas sp. TaxID=1871086 RepID=UPI002620C241|nr:BLUF domain-containing protein [Brevundimonas sp.]MDI6623574.1 BLUF domain-containing protein [Brevundimonas sp.]MDQ7812580.1 BLUF domain-containing protein [Brevundimonas sp.]
MQSSLSALSGEQIRAARALARIDQADLAKRCGLSLETIKRLERIRGPVGANSRTIHALFEVFSSMGVAFDNCEDGGMGVCLAPGETSRPSGATRRSNRRSDEAGLHRLIYYSTASRDNPTPLHELLDQVQVFGAQRKAAMDVTGILFAHGGRFLSVLEGPRDKVRQVYGAISCDRRHVSLSIISDQTAPARRFPDWRVCCGQFPSDAEMVGDEPALRDGFHPESLSPASALGLLSVMRDLTEAPPRRDLHSRCPCPLAGGCLDRACASGAATPCRQDAVTA